MLEGDDFGRLKGSWMGVGTWKNTRLWYKSEILELKIQSWSYVGQGRGSECDHGEWSGGKR